MSRVKSAVIPGAILASAQRLFAARGYQGATMSQIGRAAGTSPANVYVYYASKLEIAFALYEPWFRKALQDLAGEVGALKRPRDKIRRLLEGLWHHLPEDEHGLSRTYIEAISSATIEERYEPRLLMWAEETVAAILADCRHPGGPVTAVERHLAHVLMMAFDGFVVNRRIRKIAWDDTLLDAMCELCLATPPLAAAGDGEARPRKKTPAKPRRKEVSLP